MFTPAPPDSYGSCLHPAPPFSLLYLLTHYLTSNPPPPTLSLSFSHLMTLFTSSLLFVSPTHSLHVIKLLRYEEILISVNIWIPEAPAWRGGKSSFYQFSNSLCLTLSYHVISYLLQHSHYKLTSAVLKPYRFCYEAHLFNSVMFSLLPSLTWISSKLVQQHKQTQMIHTTLQWRMFAKTWTIAAFITFL